MKKELFSAPLPMSLQLPKLAREATSPARCDGETPATIASLNIYPIKSCRGVALRQARIDSRGLAWDRRFLVLSLDSRALTQRELPRLATIRPRMETDDDGTIFALAAGHLTIHHPLDVEGAPIDVSVWDSKHRGIDQGDEVGRWLDGVLGVFLADVPHRAETELAGVIVGSLRIRIVGPCVRCRVPTIDQITGATPKNRSEPLRTLATYRRQGSSVVFGLGGAPLDWPAPNVHVGERVQVVLHKEESRAGQKERPGNPTS